MRPWRYESGWLLLHSAMRVDQSAVNRLRVDGARVGAGGVASALVWISGSRLMSRSDERIALVPWEEGRHAWIIERSVRLSTPIKMKGLQSFWFTPRDVVLSSI